MIIREYTCRYLEPHRRVYPVVARDMKKPRPLYLRDNHVLTVCVVNRERKAEQTALLAYAERESAEQRMLELVLPGLPGLSGRSGLSGLSGMELYTTDASVEELHDFSVQLKMPVVVILGVVREGEGRSEPVYDIFYKHPSDGFAKGTTII
jgi:hypothetical protein